MKLNFVGNLISKTKSARKLPLRGFSHTSARIPELDFLRGFCVLLMIFDHLCLDLMWLPVFAENFYRIAPYSLRNLTLFLTNRYWEGAFHTSARLCVVSVFSLIGGVCCSFSRNNFVRGAKLSFVAVFLSLATFTVDGIFGANIGIIFGVLHCLAVAVFIFALLELLLKDNAEYACLALGIFLSFWGVLNGFSPAELDGQPLTFINLLRVIAGTATYGSDSVGLLPFAGIFLIGAAGGKLLYADKRSYLPALGMRLFYPITKTGRHALLIYLVHQPVLISLLFLIFYIMGVRFPAF